MRKLACSRNVGSLSPSIKKQLGQFLHRFTFTISGILHNLDIALGHILQTNSNYATKSDEEILQGKYWQNSNLY